jgi:phospho-N-acetylmuramoyl-pentapeptide-transferase
MIPLLLDYLRDQGLDVGPLRVLQYLTVRAALAMGLSFVISLMIGPAVIRWLTAIKVGQPIRKALSAHAIDLSELHGKKAGTPTMGGLLILLAMMLSLGLLARVTNPYVWLLVAMTIGYALLGFWDDYLKVTKQDHHGASPRLKLLIQGLLGLGLALVLISRQWPVVYEATGAVGYGHLVVPFFKSVYPELGWLFVPFVMVVLLATSNAVNLTDGLDGLAIGVSIANIFAFMAISYLVTRVDYAAYLYVPHIAGGGEIVVFLAALLGASLGFLWFNSHPAEIFMGDTGSMMLGGAIGTTAVLLKQELLLVVIGGVFVLEALSVIIQVTSFRTRGKRVFRMAPIHHHYEKGGMHESKIIIRFWIVAWLLALAGLGMLKLR